MACCKQHVNYKSNLVTPTNPDTTNLNFVYKITTDIAFAAQYCNDQTRSKHTVPLPADIFTYILLASHNTNKIDWPHRNKHNLLFQYRNFSLWTQHFNELVVFRFPVLNMWKIRYQNKCVLLASAHSLQVGLKLLHAGTQHSHNICFANIRLMTASTPTKLLWSMAH